MTFDEQRESRGMYARKEAAKPGPGWLIYIHVEESPQSPPPLSVELLLLPPRKQKHPRPPWLSFNSQTTHCDSTRSYDDQLSCHLMILSMVSIFNLDFKN